MVAADDRQPDVDAGIERSLEGDAGRNRTRGIIGPPGGEVQRGVGKTKPKAGRDPPEEQRRKC